MIVKNIIAVGLVSSTILQTAAMTPTVTDVKARQRYPWNGMVDIDITQSGDVGGAGALVFL